MILENEGHVWCVVVNTGGSQVLTTSQPGVSESCGSFGEGLVPLSVERAGEALEASDKVVPAELNPRGRLEGARWGEEID